MLRFCTIPAASIRPLSLPGCSNLAGGEDGPSISPHCVKISSYHGGFTAVWVLFLNRNGTVIRKR